MITLDVERIAKLKGIAKPYAFLVKNGFTHHVAHNITNGSCKGIRFDHLEKLCRALHVLPHDLFCYKPHGRGINPSNDVLLPLRKGPLENNDLQRLISTLSPEAIISLASELKDRYQPPSPSPEGQ